MIHQYISNGYHIVLDVNSGSVHVVDEQAYRVIPVVEKIIKEKAGAEVQSEEMAAEVADILSGQEGREITAQDLQETIQEILE